MTQYNLTLELAKRNLTADDADILMDAFEDFHPAVTTSAHGWTDVIITVEAESLRQAIAVGLGLGGDVVSIHGMTTREFDRRLELPIELTEAPTMSSVSEAAEHFGISRTAVQKRIDTGKLPAQKVGDQWVVLGLPKQ